uniref:Uncharacterized protein n=1 Tax=Ananas comosus var. bracteatus TaxID=296719 RepID=A0A6V7NTQ7_ANACO|nr:unnamed protein product [Ananas comosus var. bracteatus]
MPATLAQYSKIIQNPSYAELQKAANQGRRCTWQKLSAIKANCAIELALDECVALLNHMRRLKRSAERAAASSQGQHTSAFQRNTSRRIPSWNCIARENSSGSLEEDIMLEAANTAANKARVHIPVAQEAYMMEAINFTRDDENRDPFYSNSRVTTPDRSSENTDTETGNCRAHLGAPNRIMISEGDLLQPERMQNGILFNVVRREALLGNRGSDFEQQQQTASAEADIESAQVESCDAVSASDFIEDDEEETELNCSGQSASRTDDRNLDQSLVDQANVHGG